MKLTNENPPLKSLRVDIPQFSLVDVLCMMTTIACTLAIVKFAGVVGFSLIFFFANLLILGGTLWFGFVSKRSCLDQRQGIIDGRRITQKSAWQRVWRYAVGYTILLWLVFLIQVAWLIVSIFVYPMLAEQLVDLRSTLNRDTVSRVIDADVVSIRKMGC